MGRDDITPEELLQSLLAASCEPTSFELAEKRKQRRLVLAAAERTAMLARASMSKLETQVATARELGEKLSVEFWQVFANAQKTVRLAERDVAKAREAKQ